MSQRTEAITRQDKEYQSTARASKLAHAKKISSAYKYQIQLDREKAKADAIEASKPPKSYAEMLIKAADEADAIEAAFNSRNGLARKNAPPVAVSTLDNEPEQPRGLQYGKFIERCKRRAADEVNSIRVM